MDFNLVGRIRHVHRTAEGHRVGRSTDVDVIVSREFTVRVIFPGDGDFPIGVHTHVRVPCAGEGLDRVRQ